MIWHSFRPGREVGGHFVERVQFSVVGFGNVHAERHVEADEEVEEVVGIDVERAANGEAPVEREVEDTVQMLEILRVKVTVVLRAV